MADAPFDPLTPPTILGVTDIKYTLTDIDGGIDTMTYEATIRWSDGSNTVRSGVLAQSGDPGHLTSAEAAGLVALMARLRTKAETAWGAA